MYFPKSQVTTNLYTAGGEYTISSSNQNYTGFYWKTSTGKYFTGNTPQSPNPLELQSILPLEGTAGNFNNPSIPANIGFFQKDEAEFGGFDEYYKIAIPSVYLESKKILRETQRLLPAYYPNIPTDKDYQIGEYKRYFCKKTNEIIYTEISKDYYDKLINNDSTVAFEYYIPFSIFWQLIGDKKQVYKTNKNIVELVMKRQKLPMFDKYLKENYTKYYK